MADDSTLRARLTNYRDTLLLMADQLERLLASAPVPTDVDQKAARDGLVAAVELYRIIAGEDLTNILDGNPLSSFVIYTTEGN